MSHRGPNRTAGGKTRTAPAPRACVAAKQNELPFRPARHACHSAQLARLSCPSAQLAMPSCRSAQLPMPSAVPPSTPHPLAVPPSSPCPLAVPPRSPCPVAIAQTLVMQVATGFALQLAAACHRPACHASRSCGCSWQIICRPAVLVLPLSAIAAPIAPADCHLSCRSRFLRWRAAASHEASAMWLYGLRLGPPHRRCPHRRCPPSPAAAARLPRGSEEACRRTGRFAQSDALAVDCRARPTSQDSAQHSYES